MAKGIIVRQGAATPQNTQTDCRICSPLMHGLVSKASIRISLRPEETMGGTVRPLRMRGKPGRRQPRHRGGRRRTLGADCVLGFVQDHASLALEGTGFKARREALVN